MEVGFFIIKVCLVAMAGTVLAILHGENEHRKGKKDETKG